jgi:hypothetical protein
VIILLLIFAESNTTGRHNQSQQFDLAIEKTWDTKDATLD